jgi:5-methylcytosine-specific restriction endonuclease McrA
MIKIDRGSPPEFFLSDHYKQLEGELWEHFADYGREKRRLSFDFDSVAILNKVIGDELLDRFMGKCAYCEAPVGETGRAEIEHYRPKRGARGFGESETKVSEGSSFHDLHYWWLALDWNNLLIICPQCNRGKASWFPLSDESKRVPIPRSREEAESATNEEDPLVLDPCGDREPSDHLRFDKGGKVTPLTPQGKTTIELLNLNRAALVKDRRAVLQDLRRVFTRARESIASNVQTDLTQILEEVADTSTLSSRPYLGIQRQFLREWLAEDRKLADHVVSAEGLEEIAEERLEPEPAVELGRAPALDLGRIAIRRIELHNFKNIADMSIDVPVTSGDQSPWLVFLGENAVGKSTILQAIILTLMGDEHRNEIPDLEPDDIIRYYWEDGRLRRAEEGHVKIWVEDSEVPLTLSFRRGDPEFQSNVPTPRTYLLAYGPTRLLLEPGQEPYESRGKVRVRNLFRPSTPLIDTGEWLFSLHETNPENFDMMIRGLRDMLLMKEGETIEPDLEEPDKRRMLVRFKKETTAIGNLSDGYRSVVALASDLMSMLSREGTSMQEAEGVVLIDEIGTNLHPGWKKRIIGCFRQVFPRIQFIGTTHEPLVLRGLFQGETILLRRDFDDNIVPVVNLPNPNDLRIDELLTSEFFGLSSTLETDLEEIYEEYYKLLYLPNLDDKQKKRKAKLKEQLRDRKHLGTGLRDELMYEVIDKLLAKHLRSPQPMDRQQLKKETLRRVLDSWQEAGLLGEDWAQS